ncbi:MAG TPA: hypothetical protein VGJ90_00680 [Methylophilaceae bacterium]
MYRLYPSFNDDGVLNTLGITKKWDSLRASAVVLGVTIAHRLG